VSTINVETGTFMLSSYRPPDTDGDRVADSVYKLSSCGRRIMMKFMRVERRSRYVNLRQKLHYLKLLGT